MANRELVKRLREGVTAWNEWREQNPDAEADLSGAKLSGAKLSGAKLSEANLSGADLSRADLTGADLSWAFLTGARLSRADLPCANLSGAHLPKANLSRANLYGANLSQAKLGFADLSKAKLSDANLIWADLSDADLSGADLVRADLSNANLSNAQLQGADLRVASILHTCLDEADLDGARLGFTTLAFLDLRSVRGLESVVHEGPSSIGFETLDFSNGQIPETFLGGTGVPPLVIEAARLLADGRRLKGAYIYILCNEADEEFARKLNSCLRSDRLSVWVVPRERIYPDLFDFGRYRPHRWTRRLAGKVRLLPVLSPESLRDKKFVWLVGYWCGEEKQQQGRRFVHPIRLVELEAVAAAPVGAKLGDRLVHDFSNWQDEAAFEGAFQRLLKDLDAASREAGGAGEREAPPPPPPSGSC